MKSILLLTLVLLLCSCTWSWKAPQHPKSISQVSYTETTGTVPEEHQWKEEYVISKTRVDFTRTGPPAAGDLNTGTWELDVAPPKIASLFAQLEAIDGSSIKEIPPDDILDGGGSQIYRIEYGDADALELVYGDGRTYTGSESVTGPIDSFIDGLALPGDAASQYD